MSSRSMTAPEVFVPNIGAAHWIYGATKRPRDPRSRQPAGPMWSVRSRRSGARSVSCRPSKKRTLVAAELQVSHSLRPIRMPQRVGGKENSGCVGAR